MRDIKTILKELQDKVKEKNIEPVAVQLQDFMKVVTQEVKEDLWQLIKKKEVIYHQTLNGHSFSVPEEDNNNTDDEQRTGSRDSVEGVHPRHGDAAVDILAAERHNKSQRRNKVSVEARVQEP